LAKQKTVYVCSECGQESVKWLGRCPSCGQWNTMKRLSVGADADDKKTPAALSALGSQASPRKQWRSAK